MSPGPLWHSMPVLRLTGVNPGLHAWVAFDVCAVCVLTGVIQNAPRDVWQRRRVCVPHQSSVQYQGQSGVSWVCPFKYQYAFNVRQI